VVHQIDHSIQALAVDRSNPTSKGGMTSKLRAAKLATSNGATVWLASGKMDNVLLQISNAEDIGTLFKPEANGSSGRKRWIGTAAQVAGHVTIDRGAAHAIVDSSGSLLAVGITAIGGTFEKGDLISIHDSSQKEIARGLTNYSAEQLQNLVGRQSTEFAEILGSCPYDEIIHRNNMTLSDQG
jgi:glutamate 5-kinase